MARKSQFPVVMFNPNVKKILFVFIAAVVLLVSDSALAQVPQGRMVSTIEVGTDTFPLAMLPNVTIVSKREFLSVYEQNKFLRLKHNVMTVYPYAVEAARIYHEIQLTMAETNKRRDKKRYLRKLNDSLEAQFKGSLKDLTVNQGQILVKLVSRYTGRTAYDLIKEFKNPMSAVFWQNAGKIYDYDLKTMYDPQADKDIEMIVRSLENTYY